MVKSRKKTAVSYQLIPNYGDNGRPHRSAAAVDTGSTNSRSLAASGTGLAGNGKNAMASTTKRPIFHHLTRLQHGILRYRNVAESPTSVATTSFPTSSNKDRAFVYVPSGYFLQNEQCLPEILSALKLSKGLPPLLVVTAATDGAVEETIEDNGQQQQQDGTDATTKSPLEKILAASNSEEEEELDLTEDQERELLREKTHELLRSTVELCGEMGAWLLPHRPRRINGAAEILCGSAAIPPLQANANASNSPIILGMIGLDQQDQKDGFTDLIVSHIYPVENQINKVAEICYDPNVMDNTPCPELTHLLIFERRQEMRDFRDRLVSRVPDVFLAFGKTTNYAKKSLFAAMVRQSPAALITHTSSEIDHMSWMLKHADREMRKIDNDVVDGAVIVDPTTTTTATSAVVPGGAPKTYSTIPIPPLRELEVVDEELAQLLTKWPAAHKEERVVLADPRRVGGVGFRQKLLRAIDSAYYLQEARVLAIDEATVLYETIDAASDQRNIATEHYHLKMVMTTLATVVAAVLYAKIYGAAPHPSFENHNPYQIAMFMATLGLPFLIVHFKTAFDKTSRSWSSIQSDEAKLQSAIFEFRARPMSFGQAASSSQKEPLEAFLHLVHAIEACALATLSEIDPSSPPAFVVDHELSSNASTDSVEEYDEEAPPPSESSPLLLPPALPDSAPDAASTTAKWKKRIPDDTASKSNETLLTTKEYIECRINVGRERKATELRTLEQRNHTIQTIIKVVLASTSLLALLSKQWFIPIVLGVSAAFVASQDFQKYNTRVEHGETMIAQLDELLAWWNCLDVEGKISKLNEDRLVQTAESIIMADAAYTY